MNFIVVIGMLIYVGGCAYLHVNLYYKCIKLTVVELVGLVVIVVFFYAAAGMFIVNLSGYVLLILSWEKYSRRWKC